MVQCPRCKEWYHPACINETEEEVNNNICNWYCPYCLEDQMENDQDQSDIEMKDPCGNEKNMNQD